MSNIGASDIPPTVGDELAKSMVTEAMRRYFEGRRARIAPFVERHFSVAGSVALHRKAVGWDLLRAPANLVLAVPYAGAKLTAAALQAAGACGAAERVRSLKLLFQTDVGREIRWLVVTELLELPWRYRGRAASRDALAELIVSEPRVGALARQALSAVALRSDDPQFRLRLASTLATYTDTRAAAAEVATTLAMLGTGALGVHQLTPGVMTLGPALASTIAQQTAISTFPLGSTLGALWYGAFPVAASPALAAGLTGGLMLGTAVLSAFAGIVTDPLQRQLGIHRRRLERMLDALERQWIDGADGVFVVRDHYAARLLGLLDLLASVWRVARS